MRMLRVKEASKKYQDEVNRLLSNIISAYGITPDKLSPNTYEIRLKNCSSVLVEMDRGPSGNLTPLYSVDSQEVGILRVRGTGYNIPDRISSFIENYA